MSTPGWGHSGELLQRCGDGVDRASEGPTWGRRPLQATTERQRRRPRRAVAVVACALLAAGVTILTRTGPAGAATYPLVAYGDTSGTPVCDITGDQHPDYSDITCNAADHASAYIGSDGTDV